VERVEDIDGFKFHLQHEECIMIRPSGTEPVLRVYGEAANAERVNELLEIVRKTLLG
jgi:phosphomannomutase